MSRFAPAMYLRVCEQLRDVVLQLYNEHGMLHGDISPPNIDVTLVGGDVSICLIDTGCTRRVIESGNDHVGGSIAYRAPRRKYCSPIVGDMWSGGCCLIEMISASNESMFWYDDAETIGIHEFAKFVIAQDLVNLYGTSIPMYVLGRTNDLDMTLFARSSVLGAHSEIVREQLRRVRDAYRTNLVALSGRLEYNVEQERLKFREKVSGIILEMFVQKKEEE